MNDYSKNDYLNAYLLLAGGNLYLSTINKYNMLTIVTEEATQSISEFSAQWKAIENRYHPLIRLFLKLFN